MCPERYRSLMRKVWCDTRFVGLQSAESLSERRNDESYREENGNFPYIIALMGKFLENLEISRKQNKRAIFGVTVGVVA